MAKKNDEQQTTETIETTVVTEAEVSNNKELEELALLKKEHTNLINRVKELEAELLKSKTTPSSDRIAEYKYPLNKKVIYPARFNNLHFTVSNHSGHNGVYNLYTIYSSATGDIINNVEEYLLEPANVFSHE